MSTKKILTASIAVATLTTAGMALAGSAAMAPADPVMAAPVSLAHDWTGWYGDVYAGHWTGGATDNFGGANVGYLASNGNLLFGGELGVLLDPSYGNYTQFTLDGRVGSSVSDKAMVFANLGLGQDSGGVTFSEYSIGAQYAVSDTIYMRGEFVGQTAITATGSNSALRLGVGWQF